MIRRLTAHLCANRDLGGGNHLAVFQAAEIAACSRPAQFVMLKVRAGTDPLLGRPFSVARVGRQAGEPTLEILYRVVGRGTELLAGLAPGAKVGMVGPLGLPFPDPPGQEGPVFMVAGGIGIAPFPLLAETLKKRGRRCHLLYGGRSQRDLVALDLLAASGASITLATEDGSRGFHGRVTDILEAELLSLDAEQRRRSVSYVCGPAPMLAAVDDLLARHQAAGHLSMEGMMGCGFGVCLSCVVPVVDAQGQPAGMRRICMDGPSFPAGRIHWKGSVAG
ncbi:MAG: dihydroorotate dehydrogenase electron transfer subunit [Acidobacteriota bacterium]